MVAPSHRPSPASICRVIAILAVSFCLSTDIPGQAAAQPPPIKAKSNTVRAGSLFQFNLSPAADWLVAQMPPFAVPSDHALIRLFHTRSPTQISFRPYLASEMSPCDLKNQLVEDATNAHLLAEAGCDIDDQSAFVSQCPEGDEADDLCMRVDVRHLPGRDDLLVESRGLWLRRDFNQATKLFEAIVTSLKAVD